MFAAVDDDGAGHRRARGGRVLVDAAGINIGKIPCGIPYGFSIYIIRIIALNNSDYDIPRHRKHELDLVIERSEGKVVGVEVKASMTVKTEDFSGLASFTAYAGEKFLHGILFYSGDKVLPFRIRDATYHAVPISTLQFEYPELNSPATMTRRWHDYPFSPHYQAPALDIALTLAIIPVQVLGELFRVLTGKAKCAPDEARSRVLQWADSFEVSDSTWSEFQAAFDLTADHGLQIWDALILAITAENRCRLLLTEDMQYGFTWRGVTVVNPYRDDQLPLLFHACIIWSGRI